MANDVWLVFSDPKSPERDEEYNTWYNFFNIQPLLRIPGIEAVTRYKLSHTQMEWMPPMAQSPAWPYGQSAYLAVYEFNPDFDSNAIFQAIRETEEQRRTYDPDSDPVIWGGQWFYRAITERETSVFLKQKSAELPPGRPYDIWVVQTSPTSPEKEELSDRWYLTQSNLRRPGFESVTRYKLSEVQGSIDSRAAGPQGVWPFERDTHLAIWELDDFLLAVRNRRAGQEQSGPRPPRVSWMPPANDLRIGGDHLFYEPITYRVLPAWIKDGAEIPGPR